MPPLFPALPRRRVQLVLGLVVMMAISSPQYVWTLFVKPFQTATGAGLATVQITFSLLIVLQTLFSPAQGWLIDRFGPKAAGCRRRGAFGARLGPLGSGRQRLDTVPHLRTLLRRRHRHRLCRRRRSDGALVSGPARLCHWGCRGRLWHGRACSRHFPISPMLTASGAPMTLDRVRPHPRRRRRSRGARFCASRGRAKRRRPRRHARTEKMSRRRHAADADLLADVRQ